MSDPDTSRRRSEKELFFEALDKNSPEERAAFLDGACGKNPLLRSRLNQLLSDHFQKDSFLQAAAVAAPVTVTDSTPVLEGPGTQVDRYKLLEKLGEGGFGLVYMAEQKEPVKRRVALKIIKLGMDTKQVVARFEAERQALALMDHPNIAKVLDGGATDTGRPYFVMELVKGMPVTKYCDDNQLTTRERLELFIPICQAIQHAHQKGVIHRDIKPSNIMVTLHDGVPVPKVIDFGIAKATQQELTEKTIFTQYSQFIGTPAYMSPEQAEMSGLDIDTRSDIYSLGVVLYELLVGRTPLDGRELMSGGYEEIRRRIKEQEPSKPSTRISTMEGSEKTTVARHRKIAPEQLSSQLRGDLDWIVLKALEKDRTRRYETANGFAQDIKRHLANEPVVACPPSAAYRFQKAWQRNKLAFAAGAVVAVALLLGTGVSVWQAVRATRASRTAKAASIAESTQRRAAVAERERSEASAQALRERLYFADMKLAQVALEERNRGRAQDLLEKYAGRPTGVPEAPRAPGARDASPDRATHPSRGQATGDLRGWEWRYLWRLSRGDESATLRGHQNKVPSLAFSPQGRLLLSGSTDRTARLWDVDTRREIHCFTFSNRVQAVAFSPDGKEFVIASGKTVVMGDPDRPEPLRPLFAHPGDVYSIAFSADGKTLASGSSVVKLWDVGGAREITTLEADLGRLHSLSFSADGRLLAAAGRNPSLKLWDLADPRKVTLLSSHGGFVYGVAFSPIGRTLASAGADRSIHVWDLVSPQPVATLRGPWYEAWAVAFSPDGKRLATGWGDQAVRLWDVGKQEMVATLKGHAKEVVSLSYSPGGILLASGGKDGTINLWNPEVRPVEAGYVRLPNSAGAPMVSPDGRWVLTFLGGDGVSLWDALSSREPSRLTLPNGVNGVAVHPGGRLLALAKHDGALCLWDTNARSERSFEGYTGGAHKLAFSPDGRRLASARMDGTVTLFDVESAREAGSIRTTVAEFAGLKFSPDSRLLAVCGGDWTVSVWDVDSRKQVASLEGHKEEVADAAFSPDGKRLATAGMDGSAILWEVATGRPIAPPITGAFLALFSVGFSPDGGRLVAGTGDGRVIIWDTHTQVEVSALKVQQELFMKGIHFSDSDTLVATGWSEVFIWRAPSFAETDSVPGTRLE